MNNTNGLADGSGLGQVNETTLAEAGIVQVDVDMSNTLLDNPTLAVDYDARQLSSTQVRDLMQAMSPALAEWWRTCTLRLGEQGG